MTVDRAGAQRGDPGRGFGDVPERDLLVLGLPPQ